MNTTYATQLLIQEVRKYPPLYDKRKHFSKHVGGKKEVWDAIGAKVGLTGDAAKKRWRYIRDAFLFSIKRIKVKCEDKAAKVKPYKFAKDLEFLIPYVSSKDGASSIGFELVSEMLNNECHKRKEGNSPSPRFEIEVTDCVSLTSSVGGREPLSVEHRKRTRSASPDVTLMPLDTAVVEKHATESQPATFAEVSRKLDETDTFFLSMASMVKGLPSRVQADIKFELHKLIHRAEMETLPIQAPLASSQALVSADHARARMMTT